MVIGAGHWSIILKDLKNKSEWKSVFCQSWKFCVKKLGRYEKKNVVPNRFTNLKV